MDFFDLHCDTPYEIFKKNYNFDDKRLAVSARYTPLFKKWIVCSAIWLKDDLEDPFSHYRNILCSFQKKRREYVGERYKTILSVEGGSLIENDLDRVNHIYQDGVRLMTLTWNGENALAGGVYSDKRLTALGKQVLLRMNDLKMVCDLAHLNEKSFYDALNYARRPIVSHTCFYSVNPHPRNLNDQQLKLIAEKNGLVGLCFYPEFLGSNNVFEQLFLHIDHCLKMGFESILSIGSDFDGAKMSSQLKNAGQIRDLYPFLIKKGLSRQILENIFFKNAYYFFTSL